jgi:hypothetical protein
MHCRLVKTFRNPPGAFGSSTSVSVMSMYVLAERVVGFCRPRSPVCTCVSSPGSPFHSLQMTWQERHPMHLVVSISFA